MPEELTDDNDFTPFALITPTYQESKKALKAWKKSQTAANAINKVGPPTKYFVASKPNKKPTVSILPESPPTKIMVDGNLKFAKFFDGWIHIGRNNKICFGDRLVCPFFSGHKNEFPWKSEVVSPCAIGSTAEDYYDLGEKSYYTIYRPIEKPEPSEHGDEESNPFGDENTENNKEIWERISGAQRVRGDDMAIFSSSELPETIDDYVGMKCEVGGFYEFDSKKTADWAEKYVMASGHKHAAIWRKITPKPRRQMNEFASRIAPLP